MTENQIGRRDKHQLDGGTNISSAHGHLVTYKTLAHQGFLLSPVNRVILALITLKSKKGTRFLLGREHGNCIDSEKRS